MYKTATLLIGLVSLCSAQISPPGHFAFYRDEVHEIRLRFAQTDWWETLTKNYEDNDDVPYLEASLTWGPFTYSKVGVRFKGNSSYNGATTKKKPFRIKLNEFVKGQKILGMASFNLSNGWNDPSLLREKVYNDIATDAGFVGPRANMTALYINDQYWGLYTLGEIVNGDFLTNHFGKGNDGGNLYKAELNATLEDKGDDVASYKAMFEKQSNEDADDWSDVVELVKVLNRTSTDELPKQIEKILDIDSVLGSLALDNMLVNTDNYAGFLAQNYYLYKRPSDKKFVFIRWDPSLAFAAFSSGGLSSSSATTLALDWTQENSQFPIGGGGTLPPGFTPPNGDTPPPGGGTTPLGGGQLPGFPGGGAGGPGASTARPLATKLFAIPQYKVRYYQIYRWLANYVNVNKTVEHMNSLYSMIDPWVKRETQGLSTYEQFQTSMTKDTTITSGIGGGTFPGGTTPPTGGTTPPTGGTTPPTGGTTPPTGGTTPPTGMTPGDFNRETVIPGVIPMFQTRMEWVRAQLATLP